MRKSKLSDEQIVALLREAERGEKPIAQLAREHGVTEQSVYRWRRKFGGSTVPDVRRLKQLEKENGRLLRLLGQRDVEIDAMKELIAKKW
ncbi:MAG: transposase [Holophagaceae bacterium]|nr:transposase [Holophagaceae bacterium]